MKAKALMIAFLIAVLTLSFALPSVYAGGHKKGLDSKVLKKAHMILKNKEELGLSEEQVEKIKNLKIETKKSLVKQKAEIEILGIDIKAKLWEDAINTEAVNKLIDQKYELKKAKAKSLVEALASLKNILTDEQKTKLKEVYKSYGKEKSGKRCSKYK